MQYKNYKTFYTFYYKTFHKGEKRTANLKSLKRKDLIDFCKRFCYSVDEEDNGKIIALTQAVDCTAYKMKNLRSITPEQEWESVGAGNVNTKLY